MEDTATAEKHLSVDAALKARRSIRDFDSTPVPEATMEEILAAALHAPSWGNVQPYRVAVASGALAQEISTDLMALYRHAMAFRNAGFLERLKMLKDGIPRPDGDFNTIMTYPPELDARYKATGKGLYELLGIKRGDRAARDKQMGKNFSFFGAPTVLFVFCSDDLGAYAALDTGAFIQSLALAAHTRGLGTCAQAALATWAKPVKKRFDIPQGYKLICGVALGYPTDAPVNAYAPNRRTLDELLIQPRQDTSVS